MNQIGAILSIVLGGRMNNNGGTSSSILAGVSNTITSGNRESSIIGGEYNTTKGDRSVILAGLRNIANGNQVVTGHYNNDTLATAGSMSGTGDGTAFCIGNGTSTRSNAVRIDYNGKIWCKSAYSATGADYAELFEWEDRNTNNEDRRGYFVTMIGKQIKKANEGDYIIGVVSANPCILGNTDTEWQGQFLRDEFGSFIKEKHMEMMKEQVEDENGKITEIDKEVEVEFYKVNPDYDPNMEYVDRLSRQEWDAIGMLGVLSVYDDGTCIPGGFCKVIDGGIGSMAENEYDIINGKIIKNYKVIERVTENIIKVVFR